MLQTGLLLLIKFMYLFNWLCCMECGIFVPQPGVEPTPLALALLQLEP